MERRAGIIWVGAALAVGIALFLAWRPAMSRRHRPASDRPNGPSPVQLYTMLTSHMMYQPYRGGRILMPEPRLISSMATMVGPCLVSVRQIRMDGDERHLLLPEVRSNARPIGAYYLFLQVYLPDSRKVRRFHLDPATVQVLDGAGRPAVGHGVPGTLGEPMEIPQGRIYVIGFPPPAREAHHLERLQGRLTVTDAAGTVRKLPFKIAGIPLPNASRLFGSIAPIDLSEAASRALPSGLVVAEGEGASRITHGSRASLRDPLFERQNLLLGEGDASSCAVPTPLAGEPVRLSARLGRMGTVPLQIQAGDARWVGAAWDNEPLLVVLPAPPHGTRHAFVLRLSRSYDWQRRLPDAPIAFPAPAGQAGGELSGAVLVAGRPFGRGSVRIRLWQRRDVGWSAPFEGVVPITARGVLALPNLAPGEYRLERSVTTLAPLLPPGDPGGPLTDYLRYRFGAVGGAWAGETVDRLVVRPGQVTTLPPLAWGSTSAVAR